MEKRKEKVLTRAVLCFPIEEDCVLLGYKPISKNGNERKIGEGCWNGFGGGIKPGEMPIEAAARELEEECSLNVIFQALKKVAVIDFFNEKMDGEVFQCRVHVYITRSWAGHPTSSPEMKNPTWYKFNKIPWKKMMPADKIWLPKVLEGKMIRTFFHYGPRQRKLLAFGKIRETNKLPKR